MTLWWIFPLTLAAEQFTGNIWPCLLIASGLGVKWLLFLSKTAKLFTWDVNHLIWCSNKPEMLKCGSFRALLIAPKTIATRRCQLDVAYSYGINDRLIVVVWVTKQNDWCEELCRCFWTFQPIYDNHACNAADHFSKWVRQLFHTLSHHTDID